VGLVVVVMAVQQTMMVLMAQQVRAVVVVEQEEITIALGKQEQVVRVLLFFVMNMLMVQCLHFQIQHLG
jgi:hypothetical protein